MEIRVVSVYSGAELDEVIDEMNNEYLEWTHKAARGECAWICADCSVTFPDGMPDKCEWGHDSCTKLIERDKANAIAPSHEQPSGEK